MSIPIRAPILLAPEVREALAEGQPVVCLESAIVTHGLPAPHNTQSIWRAARAARNANAVFGTVGVLEGKIKIGLSDDELRALGDPSASPHKVGVRDLAFAIAQRWTGGTTLGATAWIASRVGVRVIVTGGIGGVHRAPHRDESADLTILSQAPVAVVCAGPKAICDLEATLERLETLAVPVVGMGARELPGFFYNDTGIDLDHTVDDEASAARVFVAQRALERKGGVLYVCQVPQAAALCRKEVEGVIERANTRAAEEGVCGKALTPYLLQAVQNEIGTAAISVNLGVLESNAFVAGRLARHLAREVPGPPPFLEGA